MSLFLASALNHRKNLIKAKRTTRGELVFCWSPIFLKKTLQFTLMILCETSLAHWDLFPQTSLAVGSLPSNLISSLDLFPQTSLAHWISFLKPHWLNGSLPSNLIGCWFSSLTFHKPLVFLPQPLLTFILLPKTSRAISLLNEACCWSPH